MTNSDTKAYLKSRKAKSRQSEPDRLDFYQTYNLPDSALLEKPASL